MSSEDCQQMKMNQYHRLLHLLGHARKSLVGSAACSTSCTDILPLLPEGVIVETSTSSSSATSQALGEILIFSGSASGKSPQIFGFFLESSWFSWAQIFFLIPHFQG